MEAKTLSMPENKPFQFGNHINILIKPTEACNLRCVYCFHQGDGYSNNIIDEQIIDHFCNIVFPHYNSVNIIWHGGEPSFVGQDKLSKYLKITNDIAHKYGTRLKHSMQTNGTLIDNFYINIIKKYNIGLGISYDGPHNDLTRNSTKAVNTTFELLKDIGFKYGVITVVSGINVKELIAVYNFMNSKLIDIQLNPYINTDINRHELDMSVEEYTNAMIELFDIWVEDRNGQIFIDPFKKLIKDIYNKTSSLCSRSSCMRNWLCLNTNGILSPCDRYFPDEYTYGNVLEYTDIRQVYESDGYISLMSKSINRRRKCLETCDIYSLCEGGCNSNSYFENGLENNGGYSCKTHYEIVKYILKAIEERSLFSDECRNVKNPVLIDFLDELHDSEN